ncbi:hypothetical protein SADUNF_Sadunf09G0115800 [Salix dunnii]|uniref:NAC domain-containing protein n=1 Tax=Salix dunnii TaxID=1413687 RepID=A0A835MSR1_9ROSI|nr:hypothetical protein SADUNF_Sadunf09G0115800 [Salix dunnii]
MAEMALKLDLPGFRFHPTEEELLDFYLKNIVFGKQMRLDVIGYLNIYRHDPWDLPGLSNDLVLCKIYRKATSLKVLEQRAAMEDEMKTIHASPSSSPPPPSFDTMPFCCQLEDPVPPILMSAQHLVFKKEIEENNNIRYEKLNEIKTPRLQLPSGKDKLPELHVPSKLNMEWNQDPIWSLNSPWLQNPALYADILNF